jgi:hypothetical protein
MILLAWLLVFSIHYDHGKVWVTDRVPVSRAECAKHAGDYGDGVRARCDRKVR